MQLTENAGSAPRGDLALPVRSEPVPTIGRARSCSFPESIHVLELGLATSSDVEVLVFAAERGLIVVTKDKDFVDLVTARGAGSRILWVTLGNVTTEEISAAILEAADSIDSLFDDPTVQIVQVPGRSRR